MSAIRSNLPAVTPQSGAAPAVRAAQADFFRAALAQVQAASSSQQGVRATVTPMTTEPPRASSDARSLRPGSLLDIRV